MFQSHHLVSRLPLPNCFPLHLGTAAAAAPSTHHHQLRTVKPARLLFVARGGEVDAASQGGRGEGADDGPVLLPPRSSSSSSIFATSDDPSPLQISTSVLLTGAISVFLFRSLRRRAKRAKEMRMRSTGVTSAKGLKEEALQNLKAMSSTTIQPGAPPSPVQALLGGIAAGVVAVILYKFTTTIEAALNRQAVSDNFSVRQITITVRTIVNGLCYLATFVFGINSIGLLLYSAQLAISSLVEPSAAASTSERSEQGQIEDSNNDADSQGASAQQGSDDTLEV